MKQKKNIIIVGYPKSGTNWLSRLAADLLQCNFLGDWGFETVNVSGIKTENNVSEFQIYKSHHTFNELEKASNKKVHKIIYIIRDPRDIVISGAYFFNFHSSLSSFFRRLRIHTVLRNLSFEKKKKEMIQAVLYGNKKITPWLEVPWALHYKDYHKKEMLFIKYEDLLNNPENELKNILNYLDLEVNTLQITESIKNQSFKKRQKEVHQQDHKNLIKLIRKGSSGYWKNEFTKEEKKLFKLKLKDTNNLYNF